MRELLAQQSALQEEAARAEAAYRAQQIAANVADLSAARGEDFQTIDALGIDASRLFADLGLDDVGFGELITTLQADQASLETWLATNVTADAALIVETLNALFNAGTDPLLSPPVDPDYETPIGKDPPMVDPEKSAAAEETKLLRDKVDELTVVVTRLLTQSNANTAATATGVQGMAVAKRMAKENRERDTPRAVRRRGAEA